MRGRGEAPLSFERAEQPVGVAERLLHVRLFDLDVAELDDRIALDDAASPRASGRSAG